MYRWVCCICVIRILYYNNITFYLFICNNRGYYNIILFVINSIIGHIIIILPKNRKCCPTDTGNGWWNSVATDGRYPGARPRATWWTETATPAPWVWPSSTWVVSATLLGPRNALTRRQTGARCRTGKKTKPRVIMRYDKNEQQPILYTYVAATTRDKHAQTACFTAIILYRIHSF